jgi:hypothetical protein
LPSVGLGMLRPKPALPSSLLPFIHSFFLLYVRFVLSFLNLIHLCRFFTLLLLCLLFLFSFSCYLTVHLLLLYARRLSLRPRSLLLACRISVVNNLRTCTETALLQNGNHTLGVNEVALVTHKSWTSRGCTS